MTARIEARERKNERIEAVLINHRVHGNYVTFDLVDQIGVYCEIFVNKLTLMNS